jgi:hypothetical protein
MTPDATAPPVEQPEATAKQRRDRTKPTAREAVAQLQVELEELRAMASCRRCSLPPPPLPRWPGDPRARDYRPPHSCGRARWAA